MTDRELGEAADRATYTPPPDRRLREAGQRPAPDDWVEAMADLSLSEIGAAALIAGLGYGSLMLGLKLVARAIRA